MGEVKEKIMLKNGGDLTLAREGHMEEMDLIVDPVNRKLVGAHGDEILGKIK